MRVLLDTNILIDVPLQRAPFVIQAIQVVNWAEDNPAQAGVAWHSLSDEALAPSNKRVAQQEGPLGWRTAYQLDPRPEEVIHISHYVTRRKTLELAVAEGPSFSISARQNRPI